MQIPSNLEIVIVGNKRKEIITTDFLKDIPYRVFYTTDYDLPPGFKIHPQYLKYRSACKNVLGAYRCFRGHQDAINSCAKENILVFEDDAVIADKKWWRSIEVAISLLNEFEIISLHGRNVDFSRFDSFDKEGLTFYQKKAEIPVDESRVDAALSYVLKKDLSSKICYQEYIGNPFDLFIANHFKFCFLHPTPFHHERCKGSLVENKKIVREKRF